MSCGVSSVSGRHLGAPCRRSATPLVHSLPARRRCLLDHTRHLAFANAAPHAGKFVLAVFVAIDTCTIARTPHRAGRRAGCPARDRGPGARSNRAASRMIHRVSILGLGDLESPCVTFDFMAREAALKIGVRERCRSLSSALAFRLADPRRAPESNGFSWSPSREVAVSVPGIFACIIPGLSTRAAGPSGSSPAPRRVTMRDGGPKRRGGLFFG